MLKDNEKSFEIELKERLKNKYEDVGELFEDRIPIKKKNKWGYADKNGREVISCEYESVKRFSDGLALVFIDLFDTNKKLAGNSFFYNRRYYCAVIIDKNGNWLSHPIAYRGYELKVLLDQYNRTMYEKNIFFQENTLKFSKPSHNWQDDSTSVFCNRKVQRIATKNTECCHPIFSLLSRQCIG